MNRTQILERATRLGATLYMPVINKHAPLIMKGSDHCGAGSIVLCLEDALHENDVEQGLKDLATGLLRRKDTDVSNQKTMVFVRPRNLDMAKQICEMPGINSVDGFIVPKINLINGPGWFELSRDCEIPLMPTAETAEFFDPYYVSQVRAMFDAAGRESIVAVRIGGNDLLSAMGLRRRAGRISHEGPLSYVMNMISSHMMAHGYPVSAPVFEVISDQDTLVREVTEDVERGFVSKTAIHPCQIQMIHEAFKADAEEIRVAQMILDEEAAAVFQENGAMCEPATHKNWAERITMRAKIWGVRKI